MQKKLLSAAMLEPEETTSKKSPPVRSNGRLKTAQANIPTSLEDEAGQRPAAMRKFERVARPKRSFRKSTKAKKIVHWLLPSVSFAGIVVLGGAYTFHLWKESVSAENSTYTALVYEPSAEESDDFEQESVDLSLIENQAMLRRAYLKSFGGVEALRTIDSMRTRGKLVSQGQSLDFQVVKKSPQMGLFSLESEGERERYVMNGGQAWQVIRENNEKSARSLRDDEKDVVVLASRIFDSMTEVALGLGGRIDAVSAYSEAGVDYLQVEVVRKDGVIVDCALEADTLRIVSEKSNVLREGRLLTKEIRYGDYRESDGVIRPHLVSLYYDDQLQSELLVESVRVNPGVVSSLFRVPDGLSI